MHLHTYRDESRSRHLDLIGGRGHPWSFDLVVVIASGILLMGFACAFAALLIRLPTAPPRPASRGGRPRKNRGPACVRGRAPSITKTERRRSANLLQMPTGLMCRLRQRGRSYG